MFPMGHVAKPKNAKVGHKRRGIRKWSTFIILGLFYISEMGIANDFKFSAQIDRQACRLQTKKKNAKVGHKGRGLRHLAYFYNFGTPLYISAKRKALETSNLVHRLTARPINQKFKSRSKQAWPTTRDQLL